MKINHMLASVCFFAVSVLVLGKLNKSSAEILLAFRKKLEKTKQNKEDPKLVMNFVPENLERVIKVKPIVIVLLTEAGHEDDVKISEMFKNLATSMANHKLTFLRIDIASTAIGKKLRHENSVISICVYVYGFKRVYPGEIKMSDLKHWIVGLMKARVHRINSIADIHKVDEHYFAYVDLKWALKNKRHVRTLAKLIFPITIYSGLAKQLEYQLLVNSANEPSTLWTKREYDQRIFPVNTTDSLQVQSRTIIKNELPIAVLCNDRSLKLIQESKVPVLAYYKSANDSSEKWREIVKVARRFRNFVLPLLVWDRRKDTCSTFMRNYLLVQKGPALRILSITDSVRRYKYSGDFSSQNVTAFLSEYINGNLRHYVINEYVAPGSTFGGIPKINTRMLREKTEGSNGVHLVYVYSPTSKNLDKHLETLADLQKELGSARKISLHTLNHDKNDLNGAFAHHNLPFVFFVSEKGRLVAYKYAITKNSLIKFIRSKFSGSIGLKIIDDSL